jgi:benzoyl-CoA reductase/2-hydroxyglutaryl-CoA dehydratase subunit BcrC/BadD/HgdB
MNFLRPILGFYGLVVSITSYAADPPQSLNSTLEPYLKEFGLPALSAAVFKSGEIIAAGAVHPVRKRQVNDQIARENDRQPKRLYSWVKL